MSIKDLEKFVRHFVLKCVQVIVQSRLGSKAIKTQSNPRGNDWFNLAINDIKDINEQTKKCLESIGDQSGDKVNEKQLNNSLIVIKNDWKICCEISLKSTDGNTMTLEYWFVSNEANDVNEAPPGGQPSANSPTLIIYNLYNKMSLMLKSLISVTRATPAYKLSQKGQSADSYVICYRVYRCDANEMPNEDQSQHFSSLKNLGSIRSAFNELFISFIYRTDFTIDSKAVNENTNTNTNTASLPKSPQLLPLKSDHFKKEERHLSNEERLNKPLMAAFATHNELISASDQLLIIPEPPFSTLLIKDTVDSSPRECETASESPKSTKKSEPIVIPTKSPIEHSITSSPICSSSGDSFVFVELKAPFASEEHDLGSFFNGPMPSFTGSGDSMADLSDLTNTLAEFENNAQQWDSFVESICLTENEDELKESV